MTSLEHTRRSDPTSRGFWIAAIVLVVFASSALQTAIFHPAKATLSGAVIPFAIAIILRRGRGVPETLFASLHIGYASWYLPLRFHPYLTEAALLEATFICVMAIWIAVRPSPVPIIALALDHRYWAAKFFDTFVELVRGLGIEEVPFARVYLASALVRVELALFGLVLLFVSDEVQERGWSWLAILERISRSLRMLTPLPSLVMKSLRDALHSQFSTARRS